jgi:UDP-glucose 4-epimerase
MSHDDARNEDFNLSTAVTTTVLELTELIWSKIKGDVPFRIANNKALQHDVQMRVPDVSKAHDILGFETTVGLSDMLDEVIPWVADAIRAGRL